MSKTEVKAFSEVTFTIEAGDDATTEAFKISKGEESNFIWSIFYTLLETVVAELSIAEPDQRGHVGRGCAGEPVPGRRGRTGRPRTARRPILSGGGRGAPAPRAGS